MEGRKFIQLSDGDIEKYRLNILKWREQEVSVVHMSLDDLRDLVITAQNLFTENERLRKDNIELSWRGDTTQWGQ